MVPLGGLCLLTKQEVLAFLHHAELLTSIYGAVGVTLIDRNKLDKSTFLACFKQQLGDEVHG